MELNFEAKNWKLSLLSTAAVVSLSATPAQAAEGEFTQPNARLEAAVVRLEKIDQTRPYAEFIREQSINIGFLPSWTL